MIIGSAALKHWYPEYPDIPKDLDIVADAIMARPNPGTEVHIVSSKLYDMLLAYNNFDIGYANPNILYTIKVSHLPWEGKNGKWWKHLKDAVFLRAHGAVVIEDLHKQLQKLWEEKFGDKNHISLNKAVENFFKDGVRRKFDHDWMHEHFKVGDRPAYTWALYDIDSPLMSEVIFKELPREIQLLTALEEMFVVSFERSISLPNAYMKLITSMSKGWWNRFLIENTVELLDGFKEEKLIYKQRVKGIS